MKKKLNLRERILTLVILITLPLVYFSVVYKQQADKIAALKSTVQSDSEKLTDRQSKLTDLTLKAAVAQKSLNSNDDLKKYIEANQHLSSLLRKLGADEQEHGMILKKISVEDNKKLNNFFQSSMNVEVESSFVALGNFLGALGDAETLIDVKSVVLNRIDNDLKRCTAIIEVNGYYHEGPKL